MKVFASKSNPIRCSKLAAICKCSMRIYMIALLDCEDDEGGVPAQTGSLTHKGVEAFHKEKGGLKIREKAAWDAIAKFREQFPLADVNEVKLFITPYMADMRNITAVFYQIEREGTLTDCIEQQVEFTLPPHEFDPTGLPIHIQGTLDQIRIINGIVYVDDLKTGKINGWQMIHDYAIQVAAYTFGARQLGIKNAEPGRIIRAMGYRTREDKGASPDGVFWHMPFTWADVDVLLENVRLHVALVRKGDVQFGPGPHCTYCEFGGLANCINKYKELHPPEPVAPVPLTVRKRK